MVCTVRSFVARLSVASMTVNRRPLIVRHADPLAFDLTNELVMRVAGNHQINRIVQALL